MKLNVGVQIDSIINFKKDSTFLLMKEAQRRGHKLFHYTPDKLILQSNIPFALAKEVKITKNNFIFADEFLIKLDDMDILLMRQDPPFDIRYITTTYILEKCARAIVINNPAGVRNFPEKISIKLSLPTLVTENLDMIDKFHKVHKEIVLKPLYGYAGQDILYIRNESENVKIIARFLIEAYSCPIIAQKFHNDVLSGDKRVTILDGKILGVFSRIPSDGEFRSNLCLGSKFVKASLTDDERKSCEEIGENLQNNGIIFAGIDIIGGHIIEVNLTSPTGLVEINTLFEKNVEQRCWDCFESKL